MKKKEFKTESKKLMDLMINSIYTNKEIFLRELISNASDAIDKLYYLSLTNKDIKIKKDDLEILISVDKEKNTLTISDNGIGMSKEELENNLGTIAKSGSEEFKKDNEHKENIDIIGQFGVGFYSSFMVAKNVLVISKKYGSDEAYAWESSGVDGYSIREANKDSYGTDIILTLKDDEESKVYLEDYEIKSLVKKYSDYITYPIKMDITKKVLKEKKNKDDKDEYEEKTERVVLNSLTPIWKRDKNKISDDEYNVFYKDKFNDYEDPSIHVHFKVEGTLEYNALLYIPSHPSYDYYTKDYKKGLQLYSNGVLIMEKCEDLLPDYFSFVKGVVDTPDLSLNISRETLQQNRVLKTIANSIETKIKKELIDLMKNKNEDYINFFKNFGLQIKYGIYSSYGMNKDKLQDLLIYKNSKDDKYITLEDYLNINPDSDIYYAVAESSDKCSLLPEVKSLIKKGKVVLYCTDDVDEFVFMMLRDYKDKKFINVSSVNDSLEESEETKKLNEDNKDKLAKMKDIIGVSDVLFTDSLDDYPVVLKSVGDVSLGMEKSLKKIPNNDEITSKKVLEINAKHPIKDKLLSLNEEELKEYSNMLYDMSLMVEGLTIKDPAKLAETVIKYLSK